MDSKMKRGNFKIMANWMYGLFFSYLAELNTEKQRNLLAADT